MEVFNSGVISDQSGNITINLITQNATAVRLTMRLGALVANPPTDYNGPKSPFALVTNSGAVGPVGAKSPSPSPATVAKSVPAKPNGK